MKKIKVKIPVEEVIRLYTEEFLPAKVIGRMYNTTGDTIKSRLRDSGIKLRGKGDENYGKFRKVKHSYPNCEAMGCKNKATYFHKNKIYCCDEHKYNLIIYDDIYHENYYNRRNEILYRDDNICKLATYDINGNISAEFIIDTFNLEKVQKYLWRANVRYGSDSATYISKGKGDDGKYDSLHRYLTDYKFKIVDHVNKNPLDNRMCNLREATNQSNSYNSSVGKNNNTGVIGVHYDKTRDKWKCTIKINYKSKAIRFESFDDAVKQRLILESIHAVEYSPNYNPLTNTIQLTYTSHDDNLLTYIEVDLQGNIIQFKKL